MKKIVSKRTRTAPDDSGGGDKRAEIIQTMLSLGTIDKKQAIAMLNHIKSR